jgi:serine/threonine-protein kinase HipA
MKRCLVCYKPLQFGEQDFHPACSKKMFQQTVPPALPYAEQDFNQLAREAIRARIAVTGVQTKLSLHISDSRRDGVGKRFTIVGLWGGYILKPPSDSYPQLPEVEDLSMHLARLAGLKTVPHCLIRLTSGNLAYITKRVDRIKGTKLAMEDMCQLSERLTEDKYQGSYEQIAKVIRKFSATPGLDVMNFFELVLFSFLTGNADMHLKNFSLLEQPGLGMTLSPAYDLINTVLVNPEDNEELALTLNGKKTKLKQKDFMMAMAGAGVNERQQQNIFVKMERAYPLWLEFIDQSFVSQTFKTRYQKILKERFQRMALD